MLTPALMRFDKRFQNFRRLRLRLHFCVDFRASSELIRYVDLADSYEISLKCSLVINALNCVRLFDIPNAAPFLRSTIGKYSIRQVQNTFSLQPIGISKKPHTLL